MIGIGVNKGGQNEYPKLTNILAFIYYNFISYLPRRSIFFSGICRGFLYYKLFPYASDFLFSIDTHSTLSALLFCLLLGLFFYVFFMQFGYAVIYTLGFYAEYIDPSRIVTRGSSNSRGSGYQNIQSALEYGDAIMNQKNTFGKVEYLKENPQMLLKRDSKNVKSALQYIDTMVGMKPSGEPRAKELKKYLKK